MKVTSWRGRLVLLAFLFILLTFGLLVARKYLSTPPSGPAPATVSSEPKQLREVVLYFGSPDGSFLVAEARQIEDCLEEADCLRATVQSLVDGPVTDLVAVLPSHAQVRGVTASDGVATVDFSRDLVSGHPGGSVSELLTIYSLADTLAENFPHLRQVRILVEGEPVETLKGHVDLREPVKADFSFTRPPEGSAKAAQTPVPAEGKPAAEPGRNSQ
jgi:hypothetical protein